MKPHVIMPSAHPRCSGNDGRCLKFNLGRMIEQVGDKDHAHRREMLAHQSLPNRTELGSVGKIGRPIDAICGHSANMARRPASLSKNDENVLQRLLELRKQVFAMELLLLVPTDLTGDENHASGWDDDSVGVSDRGSPTLREQY